MMIRRGWRTGALVLATVWLTGCAGTGAPLTQSGFLQDYAEFWTKIASEPSYAIKNAE